MKVHQLDPYKVGEIKELAKPERDKAKQILEEVAKQVQPILRRRKFLVPLLTEMYPSNRRLLGLNVGGGGRRTREIRLRLRRAGQENVFLEYDAVLGTMLHEIAHNVVGPHNAAFYKLLDDLNQECDELIARGISGSGAGFDAVAAGRAGGRLVGRELPSYRLRELALKAAEGRLQKQALMPSGPHTTGGDLSLRSLPPREAAAAAAERRLRDNLWCPTEVLDAEAAEGHSVDDALRAVLDNAGALQQQQEQEQQKQQQGEQEHWEERNKPALQPEQPHMQQQQIEQQPIQQPQQQQQQAKQQLQHQIPAAAQEGSPLQQGPPAARAPVTVAAPEAVEVEVGDESEDIVDLTLDSDEGGVQHLGQRSKRASLPWTCPRCTLQNKPMTLACQACRTLRPAGWE